MTQVVGISRSDLVVVRDHEFEPSKKHCIFLILCKDVEQPCNTNTNRKTLEEHFDWQMPCSGVYLLKKVAFPCKFLAGKYQIRCQTRSATLYCDFSYDCSSQIHGNNVGSASYQPQNLPKKLPRIDFQQQTRTAVGWMAARCVPFTVARIKSEAE